MGRRQFQKLMTREEWICKIILSSIPLRQLNEMRKPIGFGSGCLIDYCGKRLILTAAHVTNNDENWGIEVQSITGVGTRVYEVGSMMFLSVSNLDTGGNREIDFSYTTVPTDLQPLYHELSEMGTVINQVPREIITLDFNLEPNADKKYGFFGQSNITTGDWFMHSESKLVLDLTFVGREQDYYKFQLPSKHSGHEYFQGTSGAPILDSDGNVVALVCHGDEEKDLIYGVMIKKYQSALDIEVGNFAS
jgi:hypothetical protein